MKYRLGSLFSGIGGFELGFEMTGEFETVFQVENNPRARRVLAKHWPAVERFDDVRTVNAVTLPQCDILIGGFPCQDLSIAGRRAGLDGDRSGLWWEFQRLIGDIRPRVAVLENVAGLFTAGFDRVLGSLAEIGYDASWTVISAASQGAPHKRDRVFIVAYPALRPRRLSDRPKNEETQADVARACNGWVTADAESLRLQKSQGHGGSGTQKPVTAFNSAASPSWAGGEFGIPDPTSKRIHAQPRIRGMGDGLPVGVDAVRVTRSDRVQLLGNAVVPQVAFYVAQRVIYSGLLGEVSE